MEAFQGYKLWLALHLHFTTDYDYFLNDGHVKANVTSFQLRKDKLNFYKLVKRHQDLEGFYVANLVYGDVNWSGDLMKPEADQNYKRWLRMQNAISHLFKDELRTILTDHSLVDLIQIESGQNPLLLTRVYRHEVSPETLLILDLLYPFIDTWNVHLTDDVIWPKFYKKMCKYRPWVRKLDLNKFQMIVIEVTNEENKIPMHQV